MMIEVLELNLITYGNVLTASGNQSVYLKSNINVGGREDVYLGAILSISRYNKGRIGITVGNTVDKGTISEVGSNIIVTNKCNGNYTEGANTAGVFLGSTGTADLDGHIALPVIVRASVFGNSSEQPTDSEWRTIYDNYCTIILKK